jgi:hypothetical protein
VRHAKHRANYKAIGVKRWIQAGARHSYASYWLSEFEDINRLTLQLGHHDSGMLWERYHAGVFKSAAKRFWSILPPKPVENVVAFTKSA